MTHLRDRPGDEERGGGQQGGVGVAVEGCEALDREVFGEGQGQNLDAVHQALEEDAWQEGAQLYVFTAEVFGEKQ